MGGGSNLRPWNAFVSSQPWRLTLGTCAWSRGISMLLGILPEPLRRDIDGARSVSTVSILYRLFVVFQPGGGAERTSLLKSLMEVRVGTTIHDVLGTIRLSTGSADPHAGVGEDV